MTPELYPSTVIRRVGLPLLAVLLVWAGPARLARAQSVFEAIGKEVNQLFEKAEPAMVRVRSEGDLLTMAGSGFFIDDQGTLLTAAAIIADGGRASVQIDGKWVDAKIIGLDRRSGVAMLKVVEGLTPFLSIGSAQGLKSGLAVVGVGFPRNQPVAPSFGLVSGFDFRYLDRYFPTTHIRANVPVSPGQVGGPLLNTRGEVVGLIVTAIDEGRSVYALPSEAIQKILGDFRKHGEARHGWVGVGVRALRPDEGSARLVKIAHLFDDTPAASSGLRPGDVILRIAGRAISVPSDIIDASFFSRVGEPLEVTVVRDGAERTFSFTVRERPRTMPGVHSEEESEPQFAKPTQEQQPQAIPVNAR